MAGAALEVRIDDTQLRAMLERAANIGGADVLHAAWDAIGEAMVSKTMRRFDEQHGPDGAPWLPSKAAKKEGRKTLIKTGNLRNRFTHNVLPGNAGVEWGTNVVYAAIHQFGGTIQRGARQQTIHRRIDKRTGELSSKFVKKSKSNFASVHAVAAHAITMPARPFLGIDGEDIKEAEGMLTLAVEQYLAGNKAA
jgi:phage virion morphogenesis protein